MYTVYVHMLVASCVRLFETMDCSQPGSSVYGILQARILEWVAILFSRDIYTMIEQIRKYSADNESQTSLCQIRMLQ